MKTKREREKFVALIILEKLADCPEILESGLMMAEWLYEVMTTRGELIGLAQVLKSKPHRVDCSQLLERISRAVEL